MPSAKGKFVRVTVDMDREEYDALRREVEKWGTTNAEFIRRAIEDRIRKFNVPGMNVDDVILKPTKKFRRDVEVQ